MDRLLVVLSALLLTSCLHYNPIGADGQPCSVAQRFEIPERCGTDEQRKVWGITLAHCSAYCEAQFPRLNVRDISMAWDGTERPPAQSCGCSDSPNPWILQSVLKGREVRDLGLAPDGG